MLSGRADGFVSTRPVVQDVSVYGKKHYSFMHFGSFAPSSMKRALVLGLISRVDTYTYPETAKAGVLRLALRMLKEGCGFPVKFLERCSQERSQSFEWIHDVDWSSLG